LQEGEPVVGKENIKNAIANAASMFKQDKPIKIDTSTGTIDAQQSADGGVILLVTGCVRVGADNDPEQTVQNFVQNFYLAPQSTDANSGKYLGSSLNLWCFQNTLTQNVSRNVK
jgi:hypothetical protein